MRDNPLNESLKSVINRTAHSSLKEATAKKLQPITRTFTRFVNSKIIPKLNEATGLEWHLSKNRGSLGPWDTSMAYTVYASEKGNTYNIEWYISAKNEGKFEVRITATQNRRNIAFVNYHDSAAIRAGDFKNLNMILPDQILGSFATAGEYTQEIGYIKEYRDKLVKELQKTTKAVNAIVAAVDKGLKAKDPKRGLASQAETVKKHSWNLQHMDSTARFIREQMETIASGK